MADVAYFIGEDAPKMTGLRQPALPPGRDFDYINAEVIEKKLSVKDGRLMLPHGTTYRVLVLPPLTTMRPEVLRKIRDLVQAGATVVGSAPSRSPSLENYPQCDEEVRKLAAEVWGDQQGPAGEHRFGQGRVVWGKDLGEVLGEIGVGPDFQSGSKLRYTHRRAGDTDIYFVANPQPQELVTTAAFRVSGKAPEFWWPDSSRRERPAVYDEAGGVVRLPIHIGPHGSVFVVFRSSSATSDRIVSVTRNGVSLTVTKWSRPSAEAGAGNNAAISNNFTVAVWAKPAADTTLLPETNRGVHGLGEPRNDALFPPHGNTFGDAHHAGSGLAVGRNGVVVFEHGADYFAPVLVYAARLTNWTHLAVVYHDGQPSLYVNGVQVHRGVKSDHIVHPGAGQGRGGGSPFRGELGSWEKFPRPLADREITSLMKKMPRPSQPLPQDAIELTQGGDGAIQAEVWRAGTYRLQSADGKTQTLNVASVPAPIEMPGPWEVRFDTRWGGPEKVTFDKLEDWTQRPEDGIRHYSGKAIYRNAFTVTEAVLRQSHLRFALDLGKVRDLATVRLNGQDLGTLWNAPWRVDISKVVRPGRNELEIEVINPWNNRLAGDANLAPEKRLTFLAAATVSKNAPLMSAGLLGPVTVQMAEVVTPRK